MKTPHRRKGFTLIELLVVMTIIAILAGAIFAAAGYALKRARIVQAQNIAVGLVHGINNFQSEYNRWPFPGGTRAEQHQSNSAFLVNLIGRDRSVNKRGINFVDNIPPARGTPPVGGIVYSGNSGDVFDPWESFFDIFIDHDGNGEISNPDGGAPLRLRVAVFSKGQDGEATGTNSDGVDATKDNVRSW